MPSPPKLSPRARSLQIAKNEANRRRRERKRVNALLQYLWVRNFLNKNISKK